MSPGFAASVLAWLKEEQNIPAASVEQVSGDGTDWNGSTDAGFYSSFGVTVRYLDLNGAPHRHEVAGDDMESLWSWLVKEWRG